MSVRLTGLSSGLDTDSIVSELVSAYSYKVESYEKDKTLLEWTGDAWDSLNSDVYSFYTKQLGTMRMQSAYTSMTTSVSDETAASVTASSSAVEGSMSLSINNLASSGYLTGGVVGDGDQGYTSSTTLEEMGYTGGDATIDVTIGDSTTSITLSASSTISDVVSQFKAAGLTASFDTTNQRFFLSSSQSGEDYDFDVTANSDSEDATAALQTLGLYYTTEGQNGASDDGTYNYATKVDGEDAEITLNGATFTSSSNVFSVNGLTITAKAETSSALSITTSQDSESIYDKIKSFLSEYNDLINNMTSLYNADSAKGYEPLTDDEKDAMSDTEIEKWETKIKDALLRRDGTLNSLISSLTSAMSASYYINEDGAIRYNSSLGGYTLDGSTLLTLSDGTEVTSSSQLSSYVSEINSDDDDTNDFTRYSLSSFGISTLGYISAADNEQYAYHIDGDEDDDDTSANTDKLLTAINSNPDVVKNFFSALISDVYKTTSNKMASSSVSSAYTVYNDKQMDDEMDEIEDKIDDWQEKLEELEDYWYSKFSAMETALASLQAEQSSLASLLGG